MSEELNPDQHYLEEMEEKIKVYQKNLYFLFSYLSMNIRPPLNSVVGFSRVLLKTPLNQDQQEYTESIHKSGLSLFEKK